MTVNRDEAVWYYRLGGQTLGPVAWAEIEQLTQDTIDARELLVARGGDAGWTPAADVLKAHPELAATAEPASAEPAVIETVETSGDWSAFEEPEAAGADIPWATPEPTGAATEVLGGAALERDTRPPAPGAPGRPAYAGGMRPREGLGQWIAQAWEMVSGDAVAFVLAMLLVVLVSVLSIGIAAPPLQAGLFLMALKRYRGEPISAGTVFEGFQFFLPSWGLALVQGLLGAVIGGILGGVLGGALGAAGVSQETIGVAGQFVGSIIGLVLAAAFFYSWVLMVDRRMGVMEAINNSWSITSQEFLSYIGIVFVLQLIAMAGVIACGVGVLFTFPLLPAATVAAYMWRFRNISNPGAILR